jgi:hypothetical protein
VEAAEEDKEGLGQDALTDRRRSPSRDELSAKGAVGRREQAGTRIGASWLCGKSGIRLCAAVLVDLGDGEDETRCAVWGLAASRVDRVSGDEATRRELLSAPMRVFFARMSLRSAVAAPCSSTPPSSSSLHRSSACASRLASLRLFYVSSLFLACAWVWLCLLSKKRAPLGVWCVVYRDVLYATSIWGINTQMHGLHGHARCTQ